MLDESTHREYILYLCPTGPLLDQLDKFYSESLRTGFNAAHNYLPHITLCSFFQAPDESAGILLSGLEHCVEKMKTDLPTSIRLEHFNSPQFIGLFLNEEQNDILKRLANMFMRECSEFSKYQMYERTSNRISMQSLVANWVPCMSSAHVSLGVHRIHS